MKPGKIFTYRQRRLEQNLAHHSLHYETEEEQSKVIRKPTLLYHQEWPPDDRQLQGYSEVNWNPIEILYLKRFKEAIDSYGMHSPFVKQMLNSWTTWNRIIPGDLKDLIIAVLEADPQLQWKTW